MFGTYVKRGAVSGLAGGVTLAVVLRVLGERTIDGAVRLENQLAPPAPGHHDMFTRPTQHVGGIVAAVVFGVALGVVFAIVLAAVRHRMAGPGDARRAVALAAVSFVTVTLAPFLKYPANPPGTGDPATITRRTLLYVTMLAWSVVTTWAAWRAFRWLRAHGRADGERLGGTAVVYVALIAIGWALLPPFTDRVGTPGQLLWRFRVESLGGLTAFWAVTGLTFGWLATRVPRRSRGQRDQRGQRANAEVATPWAASPTPHPSAGQIGQK